jgi:hypothetical protein
MSQEVLQEMGESRETQDMLAYYLLEISILTPSIYLNYPREQIIKAVATLAKSRDTSHIDPQISRLCKKLVMARNRN